VFSHLEKDLGQYNAIKEIFWASGAAMFVRASYYHEIGGLDEDFFAHMEEIDFCWRLKLNGYKVMSIPLTEVYHVGGGTLPKNSSRKTYLNFRNNFTLLFKNLPKDRLFKTFIARLVLDGIAGVRFLSEGNYKDTWAVIRAHFYFYTHMRKLILKRKGKEIKAVSQIYQRNIVFDHFLYRKNKFTDLKQQDFS
jgi:hypothetical protein